jgi:serine/threonine-protein kinase
MPYAMPDTQRIHGFNLQFAKICMQRGLATQEQIAECLAVVADREPEHGQRIRQLPDIMVERGYLTDEAAAVLRKMVEGASTPKQIGDYRIEGVLGQGGMGIVYRGRSVKTGEPVALKVVRLAALRSGTTVERFRREARAITELQHPNIVRGIEVGAFAGSQFIAMEFAAGRPLHQIVRHDGPLPIPQAIELAIAMAGALAYAHEREMIHRDIKPNNIIIAEDGTPKLLDFGLSKSSGDEMANLTLPGMGMGTPYYMPPEQVRGAVNVDNRGDIYSLGATLYEAVTGHRPIPGKPMEALLKLEQGEPIKPALVHRPDLPQRFAQILDKMLERDPADRYQDARELLADLKALRDKLESGVSPAEAAPEPAERTEKLYVVRYVRGDGSRLVRNYTFADLQRRIREGRFTERTLCETADSPEPTPMGHVPELAQLLAERRRQARIQAPEPSEDSPWAPPPRRPVGWAARHPLLLTLSLFVLGGVLVALILYFAS